MEQASRVSESLAAAVALTVLCGLSACAEKPPTGESSTETTSAPAAAAASTPSDAAPTGKIIDMMGPDWTLESFDASEPVPANINITLGVSVGKLNGHGACNRYMGSIASGDAPGKIAVGPLASTKMACSPEANAAETRYLGALQHASEFKVQDGKLLITYADGDVTRTLTYSR